MVNFKDQNEVPLILPPLTRVLMLLRLREGHRTFWEFRAH